MMTVIKTPEDEKPSSEALLRRALAANREKRGATHSLEARQVVALEQIADELTAISMYLATIAAPAPPGSAKS